LVVPKTVWRRAKHDAGKWGSRTIRELLGNVTFDYAKSPYAVLDALAVVVGDRPDAFILDFFAGSCTTLHATAFLNLRDGGQRRCILVTNNEVDEQHARRLARKSVYPGDSEYEAAGIAEAVGWPRCKHMINGHRDDKTLIEGTYATGRDIQDGFPENLEYFRLDFVDPAEVERGDAFEGILPIVWMMAGCIGGRDTRRGASPWYIPRQSPFAVLIRETYFQDFLEKVQTRVDITHVFLVTDSEENFVMMRRELGRRFHCLQLYKSYLENFRINAANPSLTEGSGVGHRE
jgi:adenine-specific DNA-methyltransferase